MASLPNGWEAMRMDVSNFIGKGKLKYDNIQDLILSKRFVGEMQVKPRVMVLLYTSRQGVEVNTKILIEAYPNPEKVEVNPN